MELTMRKGNKMRNGTDEEGMEHKLVWEMEITKKERNTNEHWKMELTMQEIKTNEKGNGTYLEGKRP